MSDLHHYVVQCDNSGAPCKAVDCYAQLTPQQQRELHSWCGVLEPASSLHTMHAKPQHHWSLINYGGIAFIVLICVVLPVCALWHEYLQNKRMAERQRRAVRAQHLDLRREYAPWKND